MSIYYIDEEVIIKITVDKIYLNRNSYFDKERSDLRSLSFDFPKYIKIRIDSFTLHENGSSYIEATAQTDDIKDNSSFFSDDRKINIDYFRLEGKEKFSKGHLDKSTYLEHSESFDEENKSSLNFRERLIKSNTDFPKQSYNYATQTKLFLIGTKVNFNKINFQDGYVLCKIFIPGIKREIEIKIPNDFIKHEYESLKDYFKKFIGNEIDIEAELNITLSSNENYISHEVLKIKSREIDKITSDLIAQIQVKHLVKNIFNKKNDKNLSFKNFLEDNQSELGLKIGNVISEEKFFQIIQASEYKFKHSQHISLLSQHHKDEIFKLRFFPESQSFLFLLEGENKYFFVLEVLNEDYATYLWSFSKDIALLKKGYNELYDSTLKYELNRLEYIKKHPPNFYRVIHDEINKSSKSFLEWKEKMNLPAAERTGYRKVRTMSIALLYVIFYILFLDPASEHILKLSLHLQIYLLCSQNTPRSKILLPIILFLLLDAF